MIPAFKETNGKNYSPEVVGGTAGAGAALGAAHVASNRAKKAATKKLIHSTVNDALGLFTGSPEVQEASKKSLQRSANMGMKIYRNQGKIRNAKIAGALAVGSAGAALGAKAGNNYKKQTVNKRSKTDKANIAIGAASGGVIGAFGGGATKNAMLRHNELKRSAEYAPAILNGGDEAVKAFNDTVKTVGREKFRGKLLTKFPGKTAGAAAGIAGGAYLAHKSPLKVTDVPRIVSSRKKKQGR